MLQASAMEVGLRFVGYSISLLQRYNKKLEIYNICCKITEWSSKSSKI